MTARISDEMLTEMRDRFRQSGRPDKRQYAELFTELLSHRQALERAREAIEFAATELGNSLRYNASTNKQAATLRSLLSTTENKHE